VETVACPSCGEENPSRFKLCGFCGTALAPIPETVICSNCGEENPSKFRLCGFCGTPLATATAAPTAAAGTAALPPAPTGAPAAPPPPVAPPVPAPPVAVALPAQEVRKFVTLVFTDLKDSTALTASIDAEAMNEIKARYFSSMAEEIERHGGHVEKNIGDAIMAVFGRIRANEDDALRGVRAAAGMVSKLIELNDEFERFYGVRLTVRTGVNTGEVVASTDETATMNLATGDAVNVAARLEQNAPANEVLIGEITYALVRDYVEAERLELTLKGKAEPVPAYRLLGVLAPTATPIHEDSPFIGREFEMDILNGVLAEAVGQRSARIVTVIGDAGVGKTRLIGDFVRRATASGSVLRGRCLAYGDGITFWPLTEIVRNAAKIVEGDGPDTARVKISGLLEGAEDREAIVDRVASAIGLSEGSFAVGDLFWGARRLLEWLARDRPLIVVVDDIHWAEETFLDFLAHVVKAGKDRPILIVCSARPDLLTDHAEWTEQPQIERIDLQPLGGADVEAMIDRLLGNADLPHDTRTRVVEAAEGNPLYIEQIVSMVREHGGGEFVVPPTINALLAARLDNLTREERAVVEPASVIGLVFAEAAVEAMVPQSLQPTVPDHLSDLDRKQFVHPLPAEEDLAFRFHHILVRDAAYQSLLKRARATLHERFVAWAEPVNRERGREAEFEEILGYHLEQAVRYRSELGPLDASGRELAMRAANKLGSAGRRAISRGDIPAAANLLQRATVLLDADSSQRIELSIELGSVLLVDGEFSESLKVIDEASDAAVRTGNARLERRAAIARHSHTLYGSPEPAQSAAIQADAKQAIEWFDSEGDLVGKTSALQLLAELQGTAGRYEEAAAAFLSVIAVAHETGDRAARVSGAYGYAIASLYGPTPVAAAIRECEALASDMAGDRRAEAAMLGVLGLLSAMAGEFRVARELSDRGRAMLDEMGPSVLGQSTSVRAARIELLADDPGAAEVLLSKDLASLEAIGERYSRSTIAGLHARALLALGDVDRAAASAALTRELADPDDLDAQVLWRSAEGRVAAVRGSLAEAVRLAEEAVQLASQTVDIVLQADALVDLATVLRAVGREDEAGPPIREALQLYEQKGAVAAVRQTRQMWEASTVG
jgi:class 3 adenylate cyclase/tetratricopeptide (TPR) repeat protein